MSSPVAERPAIKHRQKFEGHTGALRDAIHLPGGQRIITCSSDGSLRVWNTESGEQIGYPWRDGPRRGVSSMALSPDGTKVVSGGQDGAMRLWDINTGKVIAKWTGHKDMVASVCWSPDGQRVLSGSEDGTASVWDVKSGETILGPIKLGHNYVFAVVYSPDTAFITTAGYEEFINIRDAETGELVTTLNGHTHSVNCVAWAADGKTLISGSLDHSIRIWNTTTWQQIAVLTKHTDAVLAIALSPNGRILASVSRDNTARLWNIGKGQSISSPLQRTKELSCVSFSADGKLLATGCADYNTYTWDISTIVRQAGLEDLLSEDASQVKPVLDTNAMRRASQPLNDTRGRLPQGFFDDTRDHSSSTRPTPHSSAPSPSSSLRLRLLSRFSSLFHHSRRPAEIEVPYTRGLARNVKVKGKPKKKPPIPQNIMTINVAQPSQPPNSAEQQSSGAAQGQQSLQPQILLTTLATSATETPFPPDIVIKRAGCWTRFRLFLCCMSTENAANPH